MKQLVVLGLTTIVVCGTVAADEHRVAFVTSSAGWSDLGSWVDAGGATGLAAGDAICQARAEFAGLENAENFIAWLSDSDDDAYCRIHGLSGKKIDNCGKSTLPAAAGPWVRTDGYPFAPEIDRLLEPENVVYVPLRLDEIGEPVGNSLIFTATDSDGRLDGSSCNDWEYDSNPNFIFLWSGLATATSMNWTKFIGTLCDVHRSLMCLERVPGPKLPDFKRSGRLAFATSVVGSGDLSSWPHVDDDLTGIEAGDSVCRNLAEGAGLPFADSFKAWLSDDFTNAIDRFEHDGPWVRVDGVPIADNKAELVNGSVFTAITVTEMGDYISVGSETGGVWTGTDSDGTASGLHCSFWANGTDSITGLSGSKISTNSPWTASFHDLCNNPKALYCLSDVNPSFFLDRFEQPDTQ